MVRATLPYFIPFPSFIGTLGAVIKIRSRIPNRRALMDIGASGPLAGFIVALLALIVGLHLSEIVPVSTFAEGRDFTRQFHSRQVADESDYSEISPMDLRSTIIRFSWAGWLGLFVTALNLMPVGQFDGGHIVYAFGGARIHALVSKAALFVLGGLWALGPPYDWLVRPGWCLNLARYPVAGMAHLDTHRVGAGAPAYPDGRPRSGSRSVSETDGISFSHHLRALFLCRGPLAFPCPEFSRTRSVSPAPESGPDVSPPVESIDLPRYGQSRSEPGPACPCQIVLRSVRPVSQFFMLLWQRHPKDAPAPRERKEKPGVLAE